MPRTAVEPDLAHWLLSYNPTVSLDHLNRVLHHDHDLAQALINLRQQQLQPPQPPPSPSHLSSHLAHQTDRLANAQASLARLNLVYKRTTEKHLQEIAALQALCAVWQTRYRDERRAKEDAQESLREGRQEGGKGKDLNGKKERKENEIRLLQVPARQLRPSQLRHVPSPSSASSSDSPPARKFARAHSQPTGRTSRTRTSKRTLLAQLAQDLEREKRDSKRILAEKEEEIARLTADQTTRRVESQKLYESLDTLLALGTPSLAQAQSVPLPADTVEEVNELASAPLHASNPRPLPPPTRAPSSLLDHPSLAASLAAAAAHSRSRAREEEEKDGEKGDTLRLEEEVRELEREIARLDTTGHSRTRQLETNSLAEASQTADDRQSLLITIEELNSQVERLKIELEETENERRSLRVCDEYRATDANRREEGGGEQGVAEWAARVEELELERDHLTNLLNQAESHSHSLTSQLSATHSSIDALSERVRRKLEEQKGKLERAYGEIERLREGEREGEGR